MMKARVAAVDYYLPTAQLTNTELAESFPEWKVERSSARTGIYSRHVSRSDEYTSDLAVGAGKALLASQSIDRDSIDYLIVCTQTPDFFLPTTACLVQDELGLRTEVGAVDINLGCSGYIYALGMAKGLIESGQVRNVLVITAETHSKLANPADKSTRPIFGDAAAATLVVADDLPARLTGFVYGSDGSGGPHLVVPNGSLRPGSGFAPTSDPSLRGLDSNGYDMYMDGLEIFNFTLRVVPDCVEQVLVRAKLEMGDIDFFVFHQANGYLIEHLRKKLGIEESRFAVAIDDVGNTGSSTIPIALSRAEKAGSISAGSKVMVVGFGVGLSWGGAVIEWS